MAEQFSLTVTPDGAGSAQLQETGTKVQAARRPWELFTGAVQGVAQAAVGIDEINKAETATQDSLQGQNRGAERLAELATMSHADRAEALRADRLAIETGETDFSDVHNKAYLAVTTNAFFSATKEAQAESNMRDAATNVDSLVVPEMLPDGYDKTGAFEWIADNNSVDVATVRNMYLAKQTDYFTAQIQLQSNQDGVNAVKSQMAEVRGSLSGTKFYGSKASEWKAAIKSSDTKMKTAEVAMAKKFKLQSKEKVATAIGDTSSTLTSYHQSWEEVKVDMFKAYGDDPVVFKNKENEYKKSHKLAQESRLFQGGNTPGEAHPKLPDGNSQLTAEWQKSVTKSATAAFTENQYTRFIGIGINEPKFVKNAGDNLMSIFNNTQDIVGLSGFANKIETISYQPNGATALRQMFGDDNYVTILATQYMAKSGHATDVLQARTMVEKSKANITTIQMDKQDMIKIDEYARDFGPQQGQSFKAVMTKLHQINPKMAHDELENTANFFDKQIEKVDGVRIDTSMTPLVDNVSLDPDKTKDALMKDLENKTGSPVTDVTIIGDTALSVSPTTGALAMTSIKGVAEASNKEVLREKKEADYTAKQEEGTIVGDIGRATDTFGQVLVGQVPSAFGSFFGGAADAAGNIVDRFSGYLGKTWDEDVQSMKDGINEIFPKTFGADKAEVRYADQTGLLDEFDNIIMNTPTESPLDGVARNTLSAYLTDQIGSTVEANKHKVEVAKKAKVALEEMMDEEIEIAPEPTPITKPTDNRGLP